MRQRTVVLFLLSLMSCTTEKQVETPSLDVTVEVTGDCAQPGCAVTALDDAQLSGSSFQLSAPGPQGEVRAYGCGAFDAPLPVAALRVTLKQTDGGTRSYPLAVGAAFPAYKPARQVGSGFYFDLNFDGGIEAVDPEITVADKGPGTVTMRYAAPELYLIDGGLLKTPGLQVIETFTYELNTRPVTFTYEPVCAPERSPGFY